MRICLRNSCNNKTKNDFYCSVLCQRKDVARKLGLSNKGRHHTNKTKKKIRKTLIFGLNSRVGKTYREIYGNKKSKEIRKKLVKSHTGITQTEESNRKRRIYKVNEIKKHGIWFTIGKHETQLLNEQEKIDNCKIQRQYVLNDLGYCVDGYCPETNTVYEVYEKRHLQHITEDLQRQKNIQNYLKCKFIIIRDY